jgi:hypothetical protein
MCSRKKKAGPALLRVMVMVRFRVRVRGVE